ncbi:MAG: type II toxin-antitoxin system RelE/ParE family toxin [Acidobacteria bacterium]|nr:type II toxin-antitoxin system RelE/ParE family toxin [Acidobacteriota bacterium]
MKLRHKGLRRLFERDDARLVPASLVRRLRQMLSDLHYAQQPGDMDVPCYRLHPLKGDRKGQWSLRVSGNWRVTFRFLDGEAIDVDLVDYH